ncbi:mycofactocin system FadH/OYE family oxidoreductase 1 [Amycolatopsis sp. GM8]|uniref:mycofactocin system FadH/OYE family oxidoreductase 1 n=1 Tax=Amycolatopsis sp. GM8 TaxID=2896530 RepID=UPI001F3813EF|nr:mycofactocin system FadH/OYE family oxidoreductase 1 [Amycolatopsis sp. GM8]
MSPITDPIEIAGRTAPSRVLFGPHETNLARGRVLSDRHVAYYAARAAGGAGVIVTETASVHDSDWPYERAPLAALCGPGWSSTVDACRPHGTLVLAGLGHTGSQGSSAFGQSALWAPSRVPDVASRELPMEMEDDEINALVAGFRDSAALAAESGMDGVEIDAGQYSLLRQFSSGLTNQRGDEYGTDKSRLLREVLGAVRESGGIVGLRLSCDELAPWAGLTPEQAAVLARDLAELVDYLVPVRGSAMSASATRPDLHTEPGFNLDLCRRITEAVEGRTLTALQGSVVDPAQARQALDDGVANLVEMTRAQIAEPELVAKVRAGAQPRPCVLSNQKCRVRDNRNPIVSCIGEPHSGHETEDVADGHDAPRDVLVIGGGPAGLEAARVLALRGHRVELRERTDRLGGMLRLAANVGGRARLGKLADWLESEVHRLGVTVRTGVEVTDVPHDAIVATGSVAGPRNYAVHGGTVVDVVDLLAGAQLPDGPIVVADPVGDFVGVGIAELLASQGKATTIVSQDQVVGTQLALTGDLADANTRLQQAGVTLAKRSLLREVYAGHVVLEDVFTAERRELECAAVVHCGHRLPDTLPGPHRAGDCVAPRTVHEAILEGRRAAMAISAGALV